MRDLQTFADARAALEEYYPTGKQRVRTYTLDLMIELLAVLDNPQDKFRVIHVAGTSGKTSTAYYAAALAHGAGLKVGLTVSPHVIEINDRVQINSVPLPQALFCSELQVFLTIVEEHHFRPSYFELMMAFAFWEFERQQVDCAVIEVGLGGTLDASNTVTRTDKICVLTDIGLDHMQVLGNTHAEIATQKAGIIGLHNSVFCYQQRPDVMAVFQKAAQTKQADLHILSTDELSADARDLPLFQQRNYSLSVAAVEYLCQTLQRPLSPKARQQAAMTHIPGRMETKQIGNKTIIIDGAHNQQKLSTLIASIQAKYPGQRLAALVSFSQQAEADQRVREGLEALKVAVDSLIVTTFDGPQDTPHIGVAPEQVAAIATDLGFADVVVESNPRKALELLKVANQSVVLVAGSFYILNHIRPLLYRR